MDQVWFEMQDLRKHKLDNSVWVPLRAEKSIRNDIECGKIGYREEFIGHGSLMIPIDKKSVTEGLDWDDIGIRHTHGFNYLNKEYSQSDIYESKDFGGVHLVLNQGFDNNLDSNEWHLHQDLVINLGLKREEDTWICPREGYVEVAKLERDKEGNPIHLQIKNQFLKDYLCARGCGLYVTSYFSRDEIFDNKSVLSWCADSKSHKDGKNLWECRILEIHEGGFPFGQKMAVSHVCRIDIDGDEDVPDMTSFPTDLNVKSEFYEKSFSGKKLYRIMAELWKYEWINPSKTSPIVLGDEQLIDISYIVDAAGNRERGSKLTAGGKWLWFNPDLVSTLLSKRGGFIRWHTRDTGSISCAPACGVQFGMNDFGLITVYAKNIGNLPSWQQQIWVGHNISPEGGISKELHASQVKAEPASTQAPEAFIGRVIYEINEASKKQLNNPFFRGHHSVNDMEMLIYQVAILRIRLIWSILTEIHPL